MSREGEAVAGRDARIARALRWIASVLDDLGVRWIVAGGLAAWAHGATPGLAPGSTTKS